MAAYFKLAAISSVCILVGACSDTVTEEINDVLMHSATFSFINTLDYSIDFHVQKRTLAAGSSGLFDNQNLAAGNLQVDATSDNYRYQFPALMNAVNIGFRQALNDNNEIKTHTNLSNGDNMWLVAWQNGNEQRISYLAKKQHTSTDTFNVRILANGIYPVHVQDTQIMTTAIGKVSDFLTLNSCAYDLKINGFSVDLCNGDFGKSYLVVADQNGQRVIVEE